MPIPEFPSKMSPVADPRKKPRSSRRQILGLILLLFILTGLASMPTLVHRSPPGPKEPVYKGRRLSQWFYNDSPDFIWIPNDVYGHIHDELWEELKPEDPDSKGETGYVLSMPPKTEWQIDARAIPPLLSWMAAKPTAFDRLCIRMADKLPMAIRRWVYPYSISLWSSRCERWHIAAFEGFSLLSTNAEPALPALSNLLYTTEPSLPLTWAIASVGPRGICLLTNALASTNKALCDDCALALGLEREQARMAIPALVGCVERGYASYHVLGALGRIGGDCSAVVPALTRLLQENESIANTNLNSSMAILLLGLQRERSQMALPVLTRLYLKSRELEDDNDRRLLRRAIKRISPSVDARLPEATESEKLPNWP
jgi:hypothetical protein